MDSILYRLCFKHLKGKRIRAPVLEGVLKMFCHIYAQVLILKMDKKNKTNYRLNVLSFNKTSYSKKQISILYLSLYIVRISLTILTTFIQ